MISSPPRPFPIRKRLPAFLAAFAAAMLILAAACSKPAADFGTTGPVVSQDDSVKHDTSKPADTLRFASFNMSIGFPVSQLLFIKMDDPAVAYQALDTLFQRYQRGQPSERIKGMAKAITELKLDVVGLQEVMSFTKDGVLINDFLSELVREIKNAGGPAYVAFGDPLNDTVLSGSQEGKTMEIKFHEGNAMLVHPGIQILDSLNFIYFSLFPIPSNTNTVTQRALGYVKLKGPRGSVWQVYNTHLEVFENYSGSQALELCKFVDSLKLRNSAGADSAPQIVLGDFNADPDTNAHKVMQRAGFRDAFDAAPADPALHDVAASCCVESSALWNPDAAFSNRRIDFVFTRHVVKVLENQVDLADPILTASGARLLASDHRLVWARVIGQ